MGTPDFAACSLRRLARWPRGEVVAVYTQPDRPAGRGHKLSMPAVKKLALELGIPVFQPASLKSAQEEARLASLAPDVLAVAAYGLLLPDAVLTIPRMAPVNVHASLLPYWRGAAPIQRAIMDGWQPDAETGVSIMKILPALDSGPVYAQKRVRIGEHTAGSLHDELAAQGAALLEDVLNALVDGTASCREQDHSLATYAAKITRADTHVVWDRPVAQVHAHVRGLSPRPGARTFLAPEAAEGFSVLLAPGTPEEGGVGGAAPGTLWRDSLGLRIACADGWYRLSRVRPEGARERPVRDLLNGRLRALPSGACGVAVPGGDR